MGLWGSESGGGQGGAEFADNEFRVRDETDGTKKIALDAGAVSPGTVRTLRVPDHDLDLPVILSGTEEPPDPAGLPVGALYFKHE